MPFLPLHLELETLALYLLVMLLGSQGFGWFQNVVPLPNSALLLPYAMLLGLCQLACLSWPLWWGVGWQDFTRGLGLAFLPGQKQAQSLGVGLLALLASLPLVYLVFLLVFAVSQAFGFDPGQGAHPIFPLLNEHPQWWYYVGALLVASLVAPWLEEIMFRGFVCNILQHRFSLGVTVLVSSLFFAMLHPQGPVGLLPLAVIGAALAMARLLTQSLWPSVLMHACLNTAVLVLARLVL